MHFQRIRKYKEDKMKVRNWGKYKYEEFVHATVIDAGADARIEVRGRDYNQNREGSGAE